MKDRKPTRNNKSVCTTRFGRMSQSYIKGSFLLAGDWERRSSDPVRGRELHPLESAHLRGTLLRHQLRGFAV